MTLHMVPHGAKVLFQTSLQHFFLLIFIPDQSRTMDAAEELRHLQEELKAASPEPVLTASSQIAKVSASRSWCRDSGNWASFIIHSFAHTWFISFFGVHGGGIWDTYCSPTVCCCLSLSMVERISRSKIGKSGRQFCPCTEEQIFVSIASK